jgi:dolichyl-phosphate beta-glucosyltransferase
MNAVDVSLVIPAYNEEARIGPTLERCARYLAASPWRWEIVVVDDGSTDGTVALCGRMAAEIPALRIVETRPNRGKGHAVRAGVRAARGAAVVMYDADGSTPIAEIARLLAPLARGEAEIAIGSRYLGGHGTDQPLWRRIWSRGANFVMQRTLVPGIVDTQCGCKAFTAAAARDLFGRSTIDGWSFDLEILALALRLGYRVSEIGVEWRDDRRSRVNPLRDLFRVVAETISIGRRLDAQVAPFSSRATGSAFIGIKKVRPAFGK